MAVPTDSLRILPLELRQCIYSHLLFDDEAGTTYVRQKPDTEDRSSCTDYMSAVLALPSNVNYDAYRQKVWAARIRGRSGGANDVEEAFLQGM